jgi:hypothetical protein
VLSNPELVSIANMNQQVPDAAPAKGTVFFKKISL